MDDLLVCKPNLQKPNPLVSALPLMFPNSNNSSLFFLNPSTLFFLLIFIVESPNHLLGHQHITGLTNKKRPGKKNHMAYFIVLSNRYFYMSPGPFI